MSDPEPPFQPGDLVYAHPPNGFGQTLGRVKEVERYVRDGRHPWWGIVVYYGPGRLSHYTYFPPHGISVKRAGLCEALAALDEEVAKGWTPSRSDGPTTSTSTSAKEPSSNSSSR